MTMIDSQAGVGSSRNPFAESVSSAGMAHGRLEDSGRPFLLSADPVQALQTGEGAFVPDCERKDSTRGRNSLSAQADRVVEVVAVLGSARLTPWANSANNPT